MTTQQKQLDDFLVRAKYNYGWENLDSSARRMVEHATDEIATLIKERDYLMTTLEYLHKHASEEFAATPKLVNACRTAWMQMLVIKKSGV